MKKVKKENRECLCCKKIFDFFIKEFNCFIEYHPILKFYHPDETKQKYFKRRRLILNANKLKECNLIVIE